MTATNATATTDLQALLQPWRATLHNLRVGPAHDKTTSTDDPSVSLNWDYPRADPESLTRAFEAIELFALLERADHDAWWREAQPLAVTSWRAYQWRRYVFETWPLARISGYTLVISRLEDVQPVCEYLATAETEEHQFSPEYLRVRRALEAAMPPGTPEIPILMGLSFELGMEGWRRMWELLPMIVPVAAIQTSSPDGDHRLAKLCARLKCVDLPPALMAPTPAPALDQLLQLCRLGVIVNKLPNFDLTLTRANAATFVTTIKEMLGSRQGGYDGHSGSVSLGSKKEVYPAITSATTDATAIDHLQATFRGDGEGEQDRKKELYWMAYALFSRQADTLVANVSLHCGSLLSSSVESMEELLAADDASTLLFKDLATSIQANKHLRLGASRFVLYDPTIPADENPVLDERRYHGLRVLGAVQDWWIVHLPGWGKAWVHTRDATVSPASQAEQELVVAGVRAIDRLELFGARDQVVTTALLRRIGSTVTKLKVMGLAADMEAWCPSFFQSCTGLRELRLGGMTCERLSQVFESVTRCHATNLECLMVNLEFFSNDNVADVIAVFDALADRRHPLSKQLRRFGVCAPTSHNMGVDITNPEMYARVLHMLENNHTLEYLQINLPVTVRTAAQSASLQTALDNHQHLQLPVEFNQIGVREKAAFLSVLCGELSTPAMRELDRGVISTIFDFAPKPRFRRVNIEPPNIA